MALTPCKECGKEISKKAAVCPHCGAKPKRTSLFTLIVGGLFAFIVLSWVIGGTSGGSGSGSGVTPPTEPDPPRAIDKSPEKQAARVQLLGKLQAAGYFGKSECRGSGADVWVQPGFSGLTFEDKQKFVGVVYAWCYDAQKLGQFVRIRSNLTNKEVGMYTAERGLDLE